MDIIIQQLPLAGAITGAESIPVDQDDITVKTTTGDLTSQGVRNTSTDTLPFAMYGSNYMGIPVFSPTNDQNKFVALAASTNPADFLNWQFIGGSINGINIATDNPLVGSSITLTPATVTFVDEGRGLVPNQYSDFVNSIMEGLNLVSRIETTEYAVIPSDPDNGNIGKPYWNQMNYCNADTFFLMFQETGTVPGSNGANMTYPYSFKSYNGLGGFYLIAPITPSNLNDFATMSQALGAWNSGQYSYPFVQQY